MAKKIPQPLLDELAALINPGLFQGSADDEIQPRTLEKRNAAREIVHEIVRRVEEEG